MQMLSFDSATQFRATIVGATVAMWGAILFTGLVLAQTAVMPSPTAHPALGTPHSNPGPAVASSSTLPDPSLDEGTAQRIAAAILTYSAIEVRGGWAPLQQSANLAPGLRGAEVAKLRDRLAITEDLPSDTAVGEDYDAALATAVRHFQTRHGLAETGTVNPETLAALNVPIAQRLRQLEASLDRLAAMDFRFGQRYVVVNIPGAFVETVEGDKVVARYSVSPGSSDRPSPTMTTQIAAVNLNPVWTVPFSIVKNDIIPRVRKDPGYIARVHMHVLDNNGAEKDPMIVDWNSDRTPNFSIRQDPGPWNALGNLRVTMPNVYSVLMHETSRSGLLGSGYELESSGCAIDQMRDLASWLLQDTQGWSRDDIDAAILKNDPVEVRLKYKVPVAWVYLTGWVTRSGLIQFREDVYGRDSPRERPLIADTQRPETLTSARASGFVLQSAGSIPDIEVGKPIKQTSYLDSQ